MKVRERLAKLFGRETEATKTRSNWGGLSTLGAFGDNLDGFTLPPTARLFEELDQVRGWCRDVAQTTSAGRQFLRELAINLACDGTPFVKSKATDNDGRELKRLRKEIEMKFKKWMMDSRRCDYCNEWDYRGLIEQIVYHLATDGECFVVTHGSADSRLQLQLVDPARCPIYYHSDAATGQSRVVMGVGFDSNDRIANYWFTDDPTRYGSAYTFYSQITDGRAMMMPARRVLHVKQPSLVRQVRGLPLLLPALRDLSSSDRFQAAAIKHAQAGASNLAIITQGEGELGGSDEPDDQGMYVEELDEGVRSLNAPPGTNAQTFPSRFPDTAFNPFIESVRHSIAGGLGVPYHKLFSDLSGVNYSSARAGELNYGQYLRSLCLALNQTLHQPVYRRWLARAFKAGDIEMPEGVDFDYLAQVEFGSSNLEVLDPVKNAQAAEKRLSLKITSPIAEIRAGGRDPEDVAKEWEEAEKLGLVSAPPPAKADDDTADDGTTDEATDEDEADE